MTTDHWMLLIITALFGPFLVALLRDWWFDRHPPKVDPDPCWVCNGPCRRPEVHYR